MSWSPERRLAAQVVLIEDEKPVKWIHAEQRFVELGPKF